MYSMVPELSRLQDVLCNRAGLVIHMPVADVIQDIRKGMLNDAELVYAILQGILRGWITEW